MEEQKIPQNETEAQPAPAAGEIWWVDLDPTKGHEQAGHRPVVVISPQEFNDASHRMIAVPVTSKLARPGSARAGLQVRLSRLNMPSVALPDQVTTLDWVARNVKNSGKQATEDEMEEIKIRLKALMGM